MEVFEDALDRIEKRMGLDNQPRAIVLHEKEGRRHFYVVWSRIDAEKMSAVQLSLFKTELRDISRELYLENGLRLPPGHMNSRKRDPKNFCLEEWQKAMRGGYDPREVKSIIQECWAASDSRDAFSRTLEMQGMHLANGDRRGYVAVSYDGKSHSISHATGKKAKGLQARLGFPSTLKSVAETKTQIASDTAPKLERFIQDTKRREAQALAQLQAKHLAMRDLHARERKSMVAGQKNRQDNETRLRAARLLTGVKGLWDRLTGERSKITRENEAKAPQLPKRDADQREALRIAQLSDRRKLQAEIVHVKIAFRKRRQELHAELAQIREQVHAPRPDVPEEQFRAAVKAAPPPSDKPRMLTPIEQLAKLREGRVQPRTNGRDYAR